MNNTDVVSLDVEVSKRDSDAVLRWRHNQPDTVLVGRVDTRIERTRYRPVCSVDVAATRICTTVHNTCITVCISVYFMFCSGGLASWLALRSTNQSTSGPVSTEMGDRVRVQFPVPDFHFGM